MSEQHYHGRPWTNTTAQPQSGRKVLTWCSLLYPQTTQKVFKNEAFFVFQMKKYHKLKFYKSLTLVRVISRPRMDVTIIIPTKMKEMCWDQNLTWGEKSKSYNIDLRINYSEWWFYVYRENEMYKSSNMYLNTNRISLGLFSSCKV